MLIAVDYSTLFVMLERCPGGFVQHIFNSLAEFKTWMGTHDHNFMVPRSAVNRRIFSAVDHRSDDLLDPKDFISDVICPICSSYEKYEIDRTEHANLYSICYRCCDCDFVYFTDQFK